MDSRTAEVSLRRTYVFQWTWGQFQQEQLQWNHVNQLLQRRGFGLLRFADPVENKNVGDLVLLDKKSSGELRTTLTTLLTESQSTNEQLRQQVQVQASAAAQKVLELELLLDAVKTRVQDLEERHLCQVAARHRRTQQLQRETQDAQRRCELLQQEVTRLRDDGARLRRKLHFTVREEERRQAQVHLSHSRGVVHDSGDQQEVQSGRQPDSHEGTSRPPLSVQGSSEVPAGVLLGAADVHRLLMKAKQHDEFFPAFDALVRDIVHTLGVSSLDDVLPALRTLKSQ